MSTVESGLDLAMNRWHRLTRELNDLLLSGNGDSTEAMQLRAELTKLEPLRRQYIREHYFQH